MANESQSRRTFLGSMGALSAASLLARDVRAAEACLTTSTHTAGEAPGLARNPGDFTFLPGLIYLQTGSLGPTPTPVMERTIAAWKELELDPLYSGSAPPSITSPPSASVEWRVTISSSGIACTTV